MPRVILKLKKDWGSNKKGTQLDWDKSTADSVSKSEKDLFEVVKTYKTDSELAAEKAEKAKLDLEKQSKLIFSEQDLKDKLEEAKPEIIKEFIDSEDFKAKYKLIQK